MAAPSTPLPLVATELLEQILINLPLRDLLLCQRVCKKWEALVSTSPTLQTRLYFRAAAGPKLSETHPSSYTFNPLLEAAFPFLFKPDHIGAAQRSDDWDVSFGDLDLPPTLESCPKQFFYSSFTRNPEVFRRPQASWRQMLLTNPPVTTVVFRKDTAGMMGRSVQECVVRVGPQYSSFAPELGEMKSPYIKLASDDVSGSKEDFLDLKILDSLRMAFFYDYIFEATCTGDLATDYKVSFVFGYYPSSSEVATYAVHNSDISLASLIDYAKSDEIENIGGLTMLIEFTTISSCTDEPEECYPRFRNDAYRAVTVGPFTTVLHDLWD